jgi:AcrR family transcriptional regulator
MKVRTQARHDAILEVARQVFLECGFERASMSEIARQVGGSKATLYGYFPSKEALFFAATQAEGRESLLETFTELEHQGKGDLRESLLRAGTALVSFMGLESTSAAHRMILAESGRSDIGQLFYEQGPKQGLQLLSRALEAAMARGELRPAEPFVSAQHLHGLLSSEVQARWFHRVTEPLLPSEAQAMAERAIDVFLYGYAVTRHAAPQEAATDPPVTPHTPT